MDIPKLYTFEKIIRDEYLVLNSQIYKFGGKNSPKNRNHFSCYGQTFPVISSQSAKDLEKDYFLENKETFLEELNRQKLQFKENPDPAKISSAVSNIKHFDLFRTFIVDTTKLYKFKITNDINAWKEKENTEPPLASSDTKEEGDPGKEYDLTFLNGQDTIVKYPNIMKFDNSFYKIVAGTDQDFFFQINGKNYVLGDKYNSLEKLADKANTKVEEKVQKFIKDRIDSLIQLEVDQEVLKHAQKGSYEHPELKIGIQRRNDKKGFFVYFFRDKPYALLDVMKKSKENYYVFPPAHIGFYMDNKSQIEWGGKKPLVVTEPYVHPGLSGSDMTPNKVFCVGDSWQKTSLPAIKNEEELEEKMAKLLYWANYLLLRGYNEFSNGYKDLGEDSRYSQLGPRKKNEIKGIEITNRSK